MYIDISQVLCIGNELITVSISPFLHRYTTLANPINLSLVKVFYVRDLAKF